MLKIRRKTILFLSVITVTIILSIWAFQYVIAIEKSNTEIVKVSHQQNILSQRIAKLVYLIRTDYIYDTIVSQRADSLLMLLPQWQSNHNWLLVKNQNYHGSSSVVLICDSLLHECTSQLNGIIDAAKNYLDNPDESKIIEAVAIVDPLELQYQVLIKQCVDIYEREENELLSLIYFLPFALGAFVIVTLVIGYMIFVHPLLEGFRKSNTDLVDVNSILATKTNELYEKLIEIKSLQESLRASEKNYRELVENVSDIIYELNDSGKFIFINKGVEKITGYTREEFLQKYFWEIFPPTQSQPLVDDLLHLMKNMVATAYRELPILTKSKSIIWIGQNITFQYGENNRMEKVKVVARDITLLKEVEKKLRDSESLYRLMSENSTDIICMHEPNEDANYRFISPSMKIVLGYAPEELIGKSPFSIMLNEDAERIRQTEHQRALEGAMNSNVEFRMIKKDGSHLWVESWSKSIVDDQGKVISIQTSTRDISERKSHEEQLKKARVVAEEAFTIKSNFLSVMSHEIRTPLNGVIGLSQLLMRENPRPDQLERIKLLNFSANNLLTLLNDILDFNKLESGKLALESVDFNLKEQLMQVVETFQVRASEKSIELNFEFSEKVPERIVGDPTRFNQVIINLISNALKFTEAGRITVQVRQSSDENRFEFSVTDTGIGIPEEMQRKIFDSFTQADASTTRKYGGSGLGLSISKQLIERMGGKIYVKSKLGEGSVFYFIISLQKATSEAEVALDSKPKRFSKSYHILIVDDDKINQLVANQFLLSWSLHTKMASSGKEAIDMVDEHAFDLILMDIQMPDMNGFEATKAIRKKKSSHLREIPILAMSAAKSEDVEEDSRTYGINGFVSKPFKADDFFMSLYTILEGE